MKDHSALKKDWVLTQNALDKLLATLDPDRERAGTRYEQICGKLLKFFQWRGCSYSVAEEYTDKTIDRVARKMEEGAEIHAQNPYLYFHGIALNVLREHWKLVEKAGSESLDDLPPSLTPSLDPIEEGETVQARIANEMRLECLDECVNKLPSDQLEMVAEYHRGEGGAKIARRKKLAEQLNLPLNALRIRMCRIRGELESCITSCVKRSIKA